MEQSQLVELIRTLQPAEIEKIRSFAAIPFFNNGRMKAQVVPLLDICLTHPWNGSPQMLKKIHIFEKLFPNQKYVEGKLEKVMVEAHKVVRAGLLVLHYFRKENEFNQAFDFAETIRIRGLDVRYSQQLVRLQKVQAESPLKSTSSYFHQFLLENAKHEEDSFHNQVKGDLNVPKALQALEHYYHLYRLSLLNRFLLQQKVANLEVSDSIISILEENMVPERCLVGEPPIIVTYMIFGLLRKERPEPSDIRSLFDLLLSYEKKLDTESLREFYTYLRNMCVLVLIMSPEHEEINFTLHELYKDNLKRGFLHYEGKIHPSRYLAISENASRVKNYEWALDFIEKRRHEVIGENESQDIYRLNLANYFFGMGHFSNCLANIPPTSPFVDYLLHGKRLELKALYELRSDLLPYKLDAFKMFLSRTSQKLLSETQRQIHSDFANLLHQLIYSKPADPKRSEVLIKRIQEKKQAAEWRWLLEKAKALKAK